MSIWTTRKEQGRNKRNNVIVDTQYGKITLAEATELSNVPYKTIHHRKFKLGWPDSKLLNPVRKHKQYKKERTNEQRTKPSNTSNACRINC